MRRQSPYTTIVLDDLAVTMAATRLADVPFDPTPYGYSREQVEAHLLQHGGRLAARLREGVGSWIDTYRERSE